MKKLISLRMLIGAFIMLTSSWLVAQPTITSFSPISGTAGTTEITIIVTGYNSSTAPTNSNSTVRIGGVRCSITNTATYTAGTTSWSFKVVAPLGVNRGRIELTKNSDGTCYSISEYFNKFSLNGNTLRNNMFNNSTNISRQNTSYNSQPDVDFGMTRLVDMDDDGDLDIVDLESNIISVSYNNSTVGNISFTTSTLVSSVAEDFGSVGYSSRNRHLNVSDFDNDGDFDILIYNTSNYGGNNAYVYTNTGTKSSPTFSSTATQTITPTTTLGISGMSNIVDLNKDGYLDVVIPGYDGRILFFLNTTATNSGVLRFSSTYVGSFGGGKSHATLDVNNDRYPDFIGSNTIYGSHDNELRLVRNTHSSTTFSSSSFNVSQLVSSTTADKIRTADLNGDGFCDFVAWDGSRSAFTNSQSNTFTRLNIASPASNIANDAFDFADYNNDGKLDIIAIGVGSSNGHHVEFIPNSTSGSTTSFGATTSVTNSSSGYNQDYMNRDFQLADFDKDGYLDLFISQMSNKMIYRNQLAPYVSVTESLTNPSFCPGYTAPTQSFTASGGTLTNGLHISISGSDFELSSDNFATTGVSSLPLYTQTSGIVTSKSIQIRLKSSLTAGSKSTTITIKDGSAGSTLYTKSLTASVNANPTITGDEYVLDGSPTTLTGSVTAASVNPWVSSNTSVVTVSSVGLISAASPFSAGKATITYTNNNTCTATKEITSLKLTQALSSFTRVSGTTAVAQTFTLNSGQTSSNIAIQVPANYQVSTDGTTYSSAGGSVSLNSALGSVSATIYVRMSGSADGTTYSGNVTIKIGSAITVQSIAVSGSIERSSFTVKPGSSASVNQLSSWQDQNGISPSSWDAPRTFTINLGSSSTYTYATSTTTWPMSGNLIVSANKTLNIGSGQTLTVSGTGSLTNNGIIGNSSGSVTISGTATYTNSGTLNIGTLTYNGTAAQTLGGTTTIGTLSNSNSSTEGVTFTAATTITQLTLSTGGDLKLGGPTTVTNLTVTNGDLDLNGKSLTVTGTLTTNANAKFAAGTSGANQTGSQLTLDPSTTFTGNIYFDETANTFQKIVIGDKVTGTFANSVNLRGGDGTSTPGILEVQSGGTLAIANGKKLTLKSGQINAMLSLPGAATGILSGDIAVERAHMGARGWRIYTHPFNSSINLSQMADDIEMIGSGGTAAGFYSNASTNASAFYYDYTVVDANRDDSTVTDLGWKPFTKANDANAEPWAKSNPIIVYNCGAVRNGNGFFNPFAATHQDGIVSLDYTVGGSFNVNDGGSVSVNANPDGLWYYLCNPYTAPVKLKDISGFSSANVENTVYYWRQRRASMSNLNPFFNRLPADWQAVDWSTADNALAIPANGAILVKLKSSAGITFTFDENDKQLTDFTKIMGATLGSGTGYSNWNDMFTEVYQPTLGDNSFLFGLNIADTAEVDNVMIFDVEGAKTSFDENDGIKYKNDGFPNVYTVSSDKKTLSNDKRNITERLNAGEESVEIPLVITNRQDLPFSKLTLFAKEVNTDLVVYVKNNQTNELTPMGLWDRFDVNFEGDLKAPIVKYSLVFKAQVSNNTEMLETSMVKVYPNPSNDQITILLNATVKTDQYEILDLMGRSVQSGAISKKQINVRDLSVGQYIIKVGSFTTRFIKN